MPLQKHKHFECLKKAHAKPHMKIWQLLLFLFFTSDVLPNATTDHRADDRVKSLAQAEWDK